MSPPLVLASGSKVRRQLLANAGLAFEVIPAEIDERRLAEPMVAAGADPAAIAEMLAEAKAAAVSAGAPAALTIGADQTLDLDGACLSKPADRAAARAQLAALSGRTHRLQSALAVARGGRAIWRFRDAASLTMRTLDAAEIERYLDEVGAAAFSSVGAYQLEGPGIRLFERIDGDYFTILGLPLLPLLHLLRVEGAI